MVDRESTTFSHLQLPCVPHNHPDVCHVVLSKLRLVACVSHILRQLHWQITCVAYDFRDAPQQHTFSVVACTLSDQFSVV